MEFHDIVTTFAPLAKSERGKLKASIKKHGCRVPVVLWEKPDGKKVCMDGRHRVEICDELKKTYPVVMAGGTEEDAIALAESLNDDRRHQTSEERNERIVRVSEARNSGQSLRSIAKEENISKAQIERDIDSFSGVPPQGTPDGKNGKVTGLDGKEYDAKKKSKKKHKKDASGAPETDSESPWVDDWGIVITSQAEKAFTSQELFDELLKKLRECKRLYAEIADLPGGAFLTVAGVSVNSSDSWRNHGLENCIRAVRDCRPTYTVCPYAYSEVKDYKHGKDCRLCHGLGWSRPLGKDEIPESLVKAAKEANGVQS